MQSLFWKKLLIRAGVAQHLHSVKQQAHGAESYLHYYSDRLLTAPLNELQNDTTFLHTDNPDAIDLAHGAPNAEVSFRNLPNQQPLSVWGLPQLRQAIGERYPVSIDPFDSILITHGATGAFSVVLDTFINPGNRVVLFDPCSPIFPLGLKHRRASFHWIPTWLEEGQIRFSFELFSKTMRGARMLVFSNPCNPSGGIFAGEDLEQLAYWAKKWDVLIYVDESFSAYRTDSETVHLLHLPHAKNRLLLANSVSQSHGLSSLRVGWLAGCKQLIQACVITATLNTPFVSPLCQQIAYQIWTNDQAQLNRFRTICLENRQLVEQRLAQIGLDVPMPRAAYFLWLPVEPLGWSGRDFVRELFQQEQVLLQPGEPFGPSGQYYVRLSYATDLGRLQEGLKRLTRFVNKRSGPQKNTDPK